MKKIKKYADGGMTGISRMIPGQNTNIGLTGIRDAASNLIGAAEGVSKMSQSLVGGNFGTGQGSGFGNDYAPQPGSPAFDDAKNALTGLGVKAFKKGGKVSSASKRADGCAQRGKTRGRMV